MLPLRSLLPLALLTGATASAQVCPGEDVLSPNHDFAGSTGWVFGPQSVLTPLAVTTAAPRDFFFIDVPPTGSGTIDLLFSHAQADLDLVLYDPSFNAIDRSETVTDNESVSFTATGSAVRLYVEVLNYSALFQGGNCGDYELRLTGQGTGCDADDIYEGTDDCDTTLNLQGFPQNAPLDLILKPGDPDWFDVQLQPQETLNLTIDFTHAVADLDLRALELTLVGCGATLDTSASTNNTETISVFNNTGNLQDVAIEAFWFNTSSGATCSDYSLTYEILAGSDPCTPDDAYENNDTACDAAPLFVGVYPGLRVGDGDPDFYSFDVPGGLIGVFAVEFDHDLGDVDLFLYTGSCAAPTLVDSSESTSDYEEVVIDLLGLPTTTVYVEVRYFTSDGGCNDYALTIGEQRQNAVGEQVCFGNVNSSGASSEVFGEGSADVVDNDLTLRCIGVPPQSIGIFINSRAFGFSANPGGSNGNLCIAGAPIGRHIGPGEILFSGQSNEVNLPLDLTMLPTANGFVPAGPGETWFFQYWHRDVGPTGATSNFSGAQRIRFE